MAEIDSEKIIEGLETIREFFRFGLPSQTTVFEVYQNILTDAIVLLKGQDAQSVLSNRVCEAEPCRYVRKGFCPKCHQEMEWLFNRKHCGFCGQEVKWK